MHDLLSAAAVAAHAAAPALLPAAYGLLLTCLTLGGYRFWQAATYGR